MLVQPGEQMLVEHIWLLLLDPMTCLVDIVHFQLAAAFVHVRRHFRTQRRIAFGGEHQAGNVQWLDTHLWPGLFVVVNVTVPIDSKI